MSKKLPFLLALFALTYVVSPYLPPTQAQTSIGVTPDWLRDLGSGVGGAYSCKAGLCPLSDEHWVTSFNVSAGATAFASSNGPLIIRSTGPCTIAGEVATSPNVPILGGLGQSGAGDFGGGGGGGGGGASAGLQGLSTVADGSAPIVAGGSRGAARGGNGGNGATPTTAQYRPLLSGGTYWPVGGSRGGQGGNGGGLGGQAGGPVILICNSINFTGTINVSGAAGLPATANNTGAGGGGGAGYVILSAQSYVANTGAINLSGGAGGSCNGYTGCGAGGNGGNGWSIAITIQ